MRFLQKILNWYSQPKILFAVGLAVIVFFTICYIILLLNKYWQFEFFSVDNVYFDQALWKVAHFQVPIVNHSSLGRINILGDHFHPAIFIFSLLYMLVPRHEIILIGMSLAYGLSAFFGMLIGFKLLKSRLTTFFLLVTYFLYLGTQNAMLYGFHELNLMPMFFMLAVWAFVTERKKTYWLGIALLLLTKEYMAVVACTLAFFIFLSKPSWRKQAILTSLISILYYFAVTSFVIPHISGSYLYNHVSLPTTPVGLFEKLTQPPEKIQTFAVSIATFAILPILNIATLPLLAQDFFLRYVFNLPGTVQYQLYYHYNIALAPILFFSSVWTLVGFQKTRLKKTIPLWAIAILIFALYFHRFYSIKGPLLSVFIPDFYQTTSNNVFLWELVNKTPTDGKIMTQNHLAYPLSHSDVYLFTEKKKIFQKIDPKYLVYDLRVGQNPNNYFPLNDDVLKKLTDNLIREKSYSIFFNKGSMYILKKND